MLLQRPLTTWLRFEGLAVLVVSTAGYWYLGASWWLFGLLFFVPDVSFAGYLAGPRLGAVVYNLAHTYSSPLVLAAASLFVSVGHDASTLSYATIGPWPAVALTWTAHISFDRALGYGLKYPTAFRDTHLGRIGRQGS